MERDLKTLAHGFIKSQIDSKVSPTKSESIQILYRADDESNTVKVITSITIVNNSEESCWLDLYLELDQARVRVAPVQMTLDPGEMFINDTKYVLQPLNAVIALSSKNRALSFIITGYEHKDN